MLRNRGVNITLVSTSGSSRPPQCLDSQSSLDLGDSQNGSISPDASKTPGRLIIRPNTFLQHLESHAPASLLPTRRRVEARRRCTCARESRRKSGRSAAREARRGKAAWKAWRRSWVGVSRPSHHRGYSTRRTSTATGEAGRDANTRAAESGEGRRSCATHTCSWTSKGDRGSRAASRWPCDTRTRRERRCDTGCVRLAQTCAGICGWRRLYRERNNMRPANYGKSQGALLFLFDGLGCPGGGAGSGSLGLLLFYATELLGVRKDQVHVLRGLLAQFHLPSNKT